MVADSVKVKRKNMVCAPFVSLVQLMECGPNGVSGDNVRNLPLEKSGVESGKETEGETGTVLIENTRETSVMERLFNTATAMTFLTVKWRVSCQSGASGVIANLTVDQTLHKQEKESVFLTSLNTVPKTSVNSQGSQM